MHIAGAGHPQRAAAIAAVAVLLAGTVTGSGRAAHDKHRGSTTGVETRAAAAAPRLAGMPLLLGRPFPALSSALVPTISVDGSLPQPPSLRTLFVAAPPAGPLGIPKTMLDAYRTAAATLRSEQPGCHLDWTLLAGIGHIESNHARGGYVDGAGNTREPILGPVLNGAGVAAIPDTDNGRLDGNTQWDRAVGPMQFIPSTWQRYAADGNGDGVSDPHNAYDAALAAGRYLCAGATDLSDPLQLRAAVFGYNHSASYVREVLMWAEAYRTGVAPLPDSDVPVAVPAPSAEPVPVAMEPDTSGDTQPTGKDTGTPESPTSDSPPKSTSDGMGSTTGTTSTTSTTGSRSGSSSSTSSTSNSSTSPTDTTTCTTTRTTTPSTTTPTTTAPATACG